MRIPFALSFVLTAFFCAGGFAQDAEDWMTFYYKNPTPERFVEEVCTIVEAGHLTKKGAQPPIVAFISQVMHANPEKISDWLGAFEGLEEEQRNVLCAAAWFSDTPQARDYFRRKELSDYLDNEAPAILKMPVNNSMTLDMLWGYFFATGSEAPIRRIIKGFKLSKYEGALERYKESQKTEKDQEEAYLDAVFDAARWSLTSNCEQHPRVLEHCETIFSQGGLTEPETFWLGAVLAKVRPDKYSIEVEKDGQP